MQLVLGSMARAVTGTESTAVHSHSLLTGLLWILRAQSCIIDQRGWVGGCVCGKGGGGARPIVSTAAKAAAAALPPKPRACAELDGKSTNLKLPSMWKVSSLKSMLMTLQGWAAEAKRQWMGMASAVSVPRAGEGQPAQQARSTEIVSHTLAVASRRDLLRGASAGR
jgi:hypothetical protein